MLSVVLLAALAIAPTADPFAPLELYNGTWTVHAQHSFSGAAGADTLVNRCTRGQAFFSCEQVVNGKPAALVVFTASSEAGKFDVDNILPNGHASSDTDLVINGDHWTFITHSAPHMPRFRTENTFHGPDNIHFEQFESPDGGKTWNKTNEGDDTRVRP
jgi:hypothetical protein